jgi:YD repeat-containing protein
MSERHSVNFVLSREAYGMGMVITCGTIELILTPCELYHVARTTLLGQTVRVTYDDAGAVTGIRLDGEPLLLPRPSPPTGEGWALLEGTAQDAKAGAVLMLDKDIIYVDGLDRWPDHLIGKKVRVKGVLAHDQKQIPDPGPDATKQGAFGEQHIIKDARWEEITPAGK